MESLVLDDNLEGRDLSARACINFINQKETMSGASITLLVLDYAGAHPPHSCLPQSEYVPRSEFITGDGTSNDCYIVTMESLTNLSRSLSINWLGEVPETYEERQAALKARFGDGFHGCLCSLCCYQKHRGDVKQVSHESSNEVAYFYMGMGDFAKAEGLLWRVIEHAMAKETDGQRAEFCLGESYHALGACLLNQGKWQEAHKVWCDGAAQVVSHKRLRDTKDKLASLKSMRKSEEGKKMSNDDSAQLPTCEEIYSEGVGYAAAVSGNRHLRKDLHS